MGEKYVVNYLLQNFVFNSHAIIIRHILTFTSVAVADPFSQSNNCIYTDGRSTCTTRESIASVTAIGGSGLEVIWSNRVRRVCDEAIVGSG